MVLSPVVGIMSNSLLSFNSPSQVHIYITLRTLQ